MRVKIMSVVVLSAIVLAATVSAEMTDPYEIYDRHFESIGGIDVVRAQTSAHIEGTIVIEGTGLEGTFVQWSESPIKQRMDVDLTVFKQTSGDNGEYAWTVDMNGKLQILRDERTVGERKLAIALSDMEFLDRESDLFDLSFEGVKPVNDKNCYVIRMTNTINSDVQLSYFDTTSFLQVRTDVIKPDGETQTISSDFRDVNGVLTPFRQNILALPIGQKQTVQITSAESNIPVDPELFQPPGTDIKDFTFANGRSAENIPFRFIENHIYLPVMVGGKERLWILDSGASMSVIMTTFAKELGLDIEAQMKGSGVEHTVDISFAQLPAYSLPGLEFASQKVAVADFTWLFERTMGLDVAGILGYDFLSRLVTRVDYANELLSFYHPDSFAYSGTGVTLDIPVAADNMFKVPLTIDGEYGGKWSLDLGATGPSFHYPAAERFGLLDYPAVSRIGFGAGGEHPSRNGRFKTAEIAGFTIADPIVGIPVNKGKGAFANTEITGNLGNTILRNFVLYLDYKRGQLVFERGESFGEHVPRDNSGVQLMYDENKAVTVFFVSPGTPAEKAGFMRDDIVLKVNGIKANLFDGLVGLREMLTDKPGTRLTFTVLREGKEKDITFTLADIYDL